MKRIIRDITGQDPAALFGGTIASALHNKSNQLFLDCLVDSQTENPANVVYIAELSDDKLSITVISGNADAFLSPFQQWPIWLGMTPDQRTAFETAKTAAEAAQLAIVQKNESDAANAKTYAKLTALKNMSPAEIQTWATANITTLAQAKDALTTLAIAVSILARRL
jgi:hypothetical protein